MDVIVDLIPSMLGLLVTPAAIAGAIILLATARPFANATAFMGGFLIAYAVIATAVVAVASARTEPLLSVRSKSLIEIAVGAALLALALALIVRRVEKRPPRKARTSLVVRLGTATPRFAFGVGLALAVVNPNIPILIAGLAVVAAADSGQVLGAVLLVLAAVSGMLIPILWRWLSPAAAARHLERVKAWIGAHDRVINVTVLLIFGTTFTAKGVAGL